MVASQLNGDKMSLRHRHNDEMKYKTINICINFLIADATPATTTQVHTDDGSSISSKTGKRVAIWQIGMARARKQTKRVHD